MNLLFITTHLERGGISSYVVSLAKALKEKSHNIVVISSGGELTKDLTNVGIKHITLNIRTKSELSPKLAFALPKLIRIIKDNNIQLIHAQNRVATVLAFWATKFTKIPYMSTCHGFFKPHLTRRLFGLWGKKVIAISDNVKAHLIQDMKVKEKDIVLIYNGVDVEKFNKYGLEQIIRFKRQIGLKDYPVIGILARLSSVKGHKFLLMAMKDVLSQIPHTQLLIVGEGKIKNELTKLADELGIKDNVFFIPSVEDNILVLSAIDIFVMPSLQEGLGLSIMEAQAAGLPVVASRVGGILNLIEDKNTGILVAPGDSQAIAKAIILLLQNRNIATRLGIAARDNIRDNFSLDRMVNATEKLYKSVLSNFR